MIGSKDKDLREAEPLNSLGLPLFGDGPSQMKKPDRTAFEIGGSGHSDLTKMLELKKEEEERTKSQQESFKKKKKETTLRMALGFLDKGADYSRDSAYVKVNGVLI